ncbi:Guanine deaminase [Klebsiella michiganensis]|uniref:Guanine deaminase n=1 Tax=Klebsiella michiganensis TaxID=1134687 RepID=A0A7H4LVH9_9ENTR|nr:Guanine deaminase [Klebsiella michiganensis]
MMMDYHAAVRGAFFDIAGVAESADDIARQARYLEDGVLFLRDGRIQALLPWQEGERFLHPQKAIATCAVSYCCRGLSMPTSTIRKPR